MPSHQESINIHQTICINPALLTTKVLCIDAQYGGLKLNLERGLVLNVYSCQQYFLPFLINYHWLRTPPFFCLVPMILKGPKSYPKYCQAELSQAAH